MLNSSTHTVAHRPESAESFATGWSTCMESNSLLTGRKIGNKSLRNEVARVFCDNPPEMRTGTHASTRVTSLLKSDSLNVWRAERGSNLKVNDQNLKLNVKALQGAHQAASVPKSLQYVNHPLRTDSNSSEIR